MRYTVLLLLGQVSDVYVAFVPALDVVTQGDTIAEAVAAAREAATLAVRGMIKDGEDVPVERAQAIVETIDVPLPVPAEATA